MRAVKPPQLILPVAAAAKTGRNKCKANLFFYRVGIVLFKVFLPAAASIDKRPFPGALRVLSASSGTFILLFCCLLPYFARKKYIKFEKEAELSLVRSQIYEGERKSATLRHGNDHN